MGTGWVATKQHPHGSTRAKQRRGGWVEEEVDGRLSSVHVDAFSWEIQPGLNFQQLYKPLVINNYKEEEIF